MNKIDKMLLINLQVTKELYNNFYYNHVIWSWQRVSEPGTHSRKKLYG